MRAEVWDALRRRMDDALADNDLWVAERQLAQDFGDQSTLSYPLPASVTVTSEPRGLSAPTADGA